MTQRQDSPQAHEERRGPPPVGTVTVVAFLVLMISTLWALVLGVLEGRA